MNRKDTLPIPEPILQLQRQLDQFRSTLPSPIQMCDALSRNVAKLSTGVEILLGNCLAHGRRQFVEVAANFPNVRPSRSATRKWPEESRRAERESHGFLASDENV